MNLIKCLAALCVVVAAQTSFAADNDATAREVAARRYLAASPVSELWADAVQHMAPNVPANRRSEFLASMVRVDLNHLEKIMLEAMAKNFTADELNALADFYGSPIGKSAMGKFGIYLAQISPAINVEVQKALQPR